MFGREQSGHHHAGLPSTRTTVQLERFDLQLRGQSCRIGAFSRRSLVERTLCSGGTGIARSAGQGVGPTACHDAVRPLSRDTMR
jgi:hypothetical protein